MSDLIAEAQGRVDAAMAAIEQCGDISRENAKTRIDERVQISVAICAGKEYCLPFLRETVSALRSGECRVDVHIVDDGGILPANWIPTGWQHTLLEAVDATVSPWDHSASRCARARAAQRAAFLGSGYTHLLLLDCDQIPPADAIAKLLSLDADCASGIVNMRGKRDLSLCIGLGRYDVSDIPGVYHTSGFNQGCMLISRAAVEAVQFREPAWYAAQQPRAWEDMTWCADFCEWDGKCAPAGILLDFGVSCWHVDSDSSATRIVVGDLTAGAMWSDYPHHVSNRFGEWKRHVPRFDISAADAATLPPGFVTGLWPSMSVEVATVSSLLG